MPERTFHQPTTCNLKPETYNEASFAYNVRFDIEAYNQLHSLKEKLAPQQYDQELARLNDLTHHNLETALGERFNVELFQATYNIKNGQIIHPTYQQPFLDIIKRGQKYRMQAGSNDIKREQAEVEGFKKVQAILTNPDTQDAKVVIISPKGNPNSIYQHNFYDIYERDENGQITMSRLTCKFSYQYFQEAANSLDPFTDLPENPTDSDFLKNPLSTYATMDEIQKAFSPQEETTTVEEYHRLIRTCNFLINTYIDSPSQKTLDALFNFAQSLERSDLYKGFSDRQFEGPTLKEIDRIIAIFGSMPVQPRATPCGLSGNSMSTVNGQLSTVNFWPFSVADFANFNEQEEVTDFQCPGRKKDGTKCTYVVRAYSGVNKCPECGMEATCG